MTPSRAFKLIVGWSAAIAILLCLSYCLEWPKYRFEQAVKEAIQRLPVARVIDVQKTIDLASPVTWFWPETTLWTFAIPDPLVRDRFFENTEIYDEKPLTYLVDVDCGDRTAIRYDLDEPDSAPPALTIWGEPVVAPNGKTYRRISQKIDSAYPEPPKTIRAYCDTDWTAERNAAGQAFFGHEGSHD